MADKPLRRWPIVRLFVSSTFADFVHERNALQQVFGNLERLCSHQGFQFQAIDLRWGISQEAGFHHRTMQICFEELRRSQNVSPRPNFLILLGNRYGWRPLPEEISQEEFPLLEKAAGELGALAEATLDEWYPCDRNAFPDPVHVLQARTGMFEQQTKWEPIEETLWEVINSAFPPEGLRNRFADFVSHPPKNTAGWQPPSIVRFQASATEQEIWRGALCVEDADQHVLACFRDIVNADGFSDSQVRDFFDRPTVDASAQGASQNAWASAELREVIRAHLSMGGRRSVSENIFPIGDAKLVPLRSEKNAEDCKCDIEQDHIGGMCAWFEGRLTSIIQRQIDDYRGEQPIGTVPEQRRRQLDQTRRGLEIERDQHWWFAEQRGAKHFFIGRDAERKRIGDYLISTTRAPLVIHGASGYGKTALLARVAIEAKNLVGSDSQLIVRFLGTTASSSDVYSLLGSLCQELQPEIDEERSWDHRDLLKEWHTQLEAQSDALIVILDALDQLSESEGGLQLRWLPLKLPANVKLIVSCLSDRPNDDPAGEPYRTLVSRLPPSQFINLGELSEKDANQLVFDCWLPQARRALNDEAGLQKALVKQALNQKSRRQPLYLKLLLDQIVRWRSYDALPRSLPETDNGLIDGMLDELGSPENHGDTLRLVLAYIASARRGLTEDEIVRILVHDACKKSEDDVDYRAWYESLSSYHDLPAEADRVPIVIWSRIRSDLSAYLSQRGVPGGSVVSFFHRQVQERVRSKYALVSEAPAYRVHVRRFFSDQPDFLAPWNDTSQTTGSVSAAMPMSNARKADELPWLLFQETSFDSFQIAQRLLQSISFLESKASAGLLLELIEDIGRTVSTADGTAAEWLAEIQAVLQQDAGFLAEFPQQVFQSLWNLAPVASEPGDLPHPESFWQLLNRWRANLPDRRFMLAVGIRNRHAGSALRWELATPHPEITGLAVSPDGTLIVTAGGSSICVWDGSRRRLLEQIFVDPNRVNAIALTPSADGIIAAISDGSVRQWDWPLTGDDRVVQKRTVPCGAVACSDDGEYCSGGWDDGHVYLWRHVDPSKRETLPGPKEKVVSIAFSPDSSMVAAATDDPADFLWRIPTESVVNRIDGLGLPRNDICFSADSDQLISTEGEYLRIQPLEHEPGKRFILSHDDHTVYGVAAGRDGTIATAAAEGVIRLWQPPYAKPFRKLELADHRPKTLRFRSPETLLSAGRDARICHWDLRYAGKDDANLAGNAGTQCVGLSLGAELAVSGHVDGTVRFWNAGSGRCVDELRPADSSIKCIAVSADASVVVCATVDQAFVLSLESGDVVPLPASDIRSVQSLAVSDDGRIVAIASAACVLVWDLPGRCVIRQFALPRAQDELIAALNADGGRLALGENGRVRVWDVASGEVLADITDFVGRVEDIALDESGQRFAMMTQYATRSRGLGPKDEWTVGPREGPATVIARGAKSGIRLRIGRSHCEIISNDNHQIVGALPLVPDVFTLSGSPAPCLVATRNEELTFYRWMDLADDEKRQST